MVSGWVRGGWLVRIGLICVALAAVPSLAAAQAASPPKPAPTVPSKTKPADNTVGAVVVTGQAPALQTSIDRRSYDVTHDLQATTGSISDALRNVPSVEVDVQGNVSLRGDPNVTILIDGKPSSLFQGDNKGQALQSLPASQIERVEVITNPSAEFRAEGTAGVINLISKKARGAGRTGSLRVTAGNAGRATASASAGYNSPKLTLTGDLNLRRDTQKLQAFEDRRSLDLAGGGFDDVTTDQGNRLLGQSASIHGGADYDLSARTRIGGEVRGNYVDFHVDGPSHVVQTDSAGRLTSVFDRGLDLDQNRANGQLAASLHHKFDQAGRELTLNLSHEATQDDRVRDGQTTTELPVRPEAFDRQRLSYDFRRTELKGDYVRPMGEGTTLKVGVDLERDVNSYDNHGFRGASTAALAPDATLTNLFVFKQTLSQAYVTYERPFGDLTVLTGLRLEDVRIDLDQVTQGQADHNNYTRLYPSLHLAWRLSDADKLTGSYSHRIQRPDPLEFNSFHFLLDPLNFRAGNPHLKPQETHSFELGYEHREGATLQLATLYYRENLNGVADVVSVLPGGLFLSTRDNVARSRNAGLELVANGRLSKTLTYNVSANAFWSELAPQPLGVPETRSALTGFGRGSLNWQASADDLVQLNAFVNGERLTPQGHIAPLGALNLGYRRKINDRLSLILTVQDLLGTIRFKQVIDTPALKSHFDQKIDGRSFMAGFTWTFGGGRQRDLGFDFQSGGPPPQ